MPMPVCRVGEEARGAVEACSPSKVSWREGPPRPRRAAPRITGHAETSGSFREEQPPKPAPDRFQPDGSASSAPDIRRPAEATKHPLTSKKTLPRGGSCGAPPAGLEPAAKCLEGTCSIH